MAKKKKITATHRLRRPHGVIFDPARHFVKGPKTGERCTLPAGTQVIPTEGQLANMPDRFQLLRVAGPPAERVIDDDGVPEDDVTGGEDSTGTDETTEEGGDGKSETKKVNPRADVQEALEAVAGDWNALTSSVLEGLAESYEITDIEGSGKTGNLVKADYLRVVQAAFGVVD